MDDSPDQDSWRRRMERSAATLRLIDEQRFQGQITLIEECLRRDAAWNLEAALSSCARWLQTPSAAG